MLKFLAKSDALSYVHRMGADWKNYAGDGVEFLTISLILAILGVSCFAARTYTNWTCTKRFLVDYWLSLLTFVCM